MISLDGFFEGPNHDLSWHNVDQEFNEFAINQLDASDTLVFGGRTYRMMADFWPSDEGLRDDPEVAKRMNSLPKIVFSRSLKSADWQNSELHTGNVAEVITALKRQAGKDIAVFGSSNLCLSLIEAGVLDELRIMVNPLVLGSGSRLFEGLKSQLKLELVSSANFDSGNVLLTYRVIK